MEAPDDEFPDNDMQRPFFFFQRSRVSDSRPGTTNVIKSQVLIKAHCFCYNVGPGFRNAKIASLLGDILGRYDQGFTVSERWINSCKATSTNH